MLEQQVPEPPSSQDAETGNRIHAWLAGETVELSDDDHALAQSCDREATGLIIQYCNEKPSIYREERLWAFHPDTMQRAWSGKPDLVAVAGDMAVVIDFKTGRGEVPESPENLQLRALAVLVAREYMVNRVVVAIIQPLAGPPTVCEYGQQDLELAGLEIDRIMERVTKQGQERHPSAQACKYCRAKEACPEAQAVAVGVPQLVRRDGREITMTGEQIAAFLALAPVAEDAIEAVRGLAKRRLAADPESVPGWTLKPGAVRESITDPEKLFARFSELGGTSAQFIAAVKVGKTDFKNAVKSATGRKGRELDETLEGLLEGITESKQAAASLTKKEAK